MPPAGEGPHDGLRLEVDDGDRVQLAERDEDVPGGERRGDALEAPVQDLDGVRVEDVALRERALEERPVGRALQRLEKRDPLPERAVLVQELGLGNRIAHGFMTARTDLLRIGQADLLFRNAAVLASGRCDFESMTF